MGCTPTTPKSHLDALRRYIEHFTEPGALVLDPFIGSGMTAVAALSSGRRCIAIDASPLATHITATSCTPLDVQRLSEIADSVLEKHARQSGMYTRRNAVTARSQQNYITPFTRRPMSAVAAFP